MTLLVGQLGGRKACKKLLQYRLTVLTGEHSLHWKSRKTIQVQYLIRTDTI